jgi:hypothetical protein
MIREDIYRVRNEINRGVDFSRLDREATRQSPLRIYPCQPGTLDDPCAPLTAGKDTRGRPRSWPRRKPALGRLMTAQHGCCPAPLGRPEFILHGSDDLRTPRGEPPAAVAGHPGWLCTSKAS